MTNRIFRSICTVAIAVFLASLVLIMGVLYDYFSGAQMDQLRAETSLAADAVEISGLDYLSRLGDGDFRITWIEADGSVKYDSLADATEMENHLEREEISEALESGEGESSRYSTTLTERRLYCAERLDDGSVLRLSVSHPSWWVLILSMISPVLIVFGIALALSLLLAYRLSRRIVRPLNELDLEHPEPGSYYEELSPLIERIAGQKKQLRQQKAELDRKTKEFDTATRNMSEGIVLLSESGTVLSINASALRLLGISSYCMGKDLLIFSHSTELRELIDGAQKGEHCERIVALEDGSYQFNASPIMSGDKVSGIALIIFDITEKEKAEEERREFSANVSHELKTPLQNISGCAELLSSGMVKPEDVPRFSERICVEAKRMTDLVEDIIKLSHLDEGAADMQWQDTDVYGLAEQALRSLTPAAERAGVKLSISGESTVLFTVRPLLSTIMYNLLDNAVKYNRPGGSAELCLTDGGDSVTLTVSDTGIGIPPESQDRVFERFYRVDKSHSKEVGGTGLGLSIVKHAVAVLGAEVRLESTPDVGTTVTVRLPRRDTVLTHESDEAGKDSGREGQREKDREQSRDRNQGETG